MNFPVLKLDRIPTKTEVGWITAGELRSARALAGFEYWTALRGERRLPRHAEIAPRPMARFLRNVVTVRVIDGGADYEYRYTGDAAVQAFGEFRNKRVSQIIADLPDYGRMIRSIYDEVCRTGTAKFVRNWVAGD